MKRKKGYKKIVKFIEDPMRIDEFRKNPVVLRSSNAKNPPIGWCEKISKKYDKKTGKCEYTCELRLMSFHSFIESFSKENITWGVLKKKNGRKILLEISIFCPHEKKSHERKKKQIYRRLKQHRILTIIRDKSWCKNPILWVIDEVRYSNYFADVMTVNQTVEIMERRLQNKICDKVIEKNNEDLWPEKKQKEK